MLLKGAGGLFAKASRAATMQGCGTWILMVSTGHTLQGEKRGVKLRWTEGQTARGGGPWMSFI